MPCEGCRLEHRELEQMEPILNFQVPAEVLELVILLKVSFNRKQIARARRAKDSPKKRTNGI